jgi:hypothetical protein
MLMQAQWHKLDRDRTVAMIDNVKSSGDHILFSVATSEAKCAKLSFYRSLLLYRLTNYSSLPSFSFDYLGDGKTYVHLDGSPNAIYAANDSGNLALSAETIIDYIVFFFSHVSGPDGDIYVIENPSNLPVLDALNYMQMDDIVARHEAPEITPDHAGGFTVKTSLYYLGSLVRATITVDAAGRVDVVDSQMLLSIGVDLAEHGVTA